MKKLLFLVTGLIVSSGLNGDLGSAAETLLVSLRDEARPEDMPMAAQAAKAKAVDAVKAKAAKITKALEKTTPEEAKETARSVLAPALKALADKRPNPEKLTELFNQLNTKHHHLFKDEDIRSFVEIIVNEPEGRKFAIFIAFNIFATLGDEVQKHPELKKAIVNSVAKTTVKEVLKAKARAKVKTAMSEAKAKKPRKAKVVNGDMLATQGAGAAMEGERLKSYAAPSER